LAAIIEKFHHHQEMDEPLQALILIHYNPFRGIEVIFRVKNGQIKRPKN
jgi:GTP-binding protein LepA